MHVRRSGTPKKDDVGEVEIETVSVGTINIKYNILDRHHTG